MDLDRSLANVVAFYEQQLRKPFIPERISLVLPLEYIFSANNAEKDTPFFIGMMKNLMGIHSIYNSKNVGPQNTLVFESQLEDHIRDFLEIFQYVNDGLCNFLTDLLNSEKANAQKSTTIDNVKLMRSRFNFGQIIRDFNESLGANFLNIGMVCQLWDFIFLKMMLRKVFDYYYY